MCASTWSCVCVVHLNIHFDPGLKCDLELLISSEAYSNSEIYHTHVFEYIYTHTGKLITHTDTHRDTHLGKQVTHTPGEQIRSHIGNGEQLVVQDWINKINTTK